MPSSKWRVQARYARATMAGVALVIIATIGVSSLPMSVHVTGWGEHITRLVASVTPQGWGFFTRDPREPFVLAYLPDEKGNWKQTSRGPNALARNLFGLNRESRLDEYDLAQISSNVNLDDLWTDCTGKDAEGCAESASLSNGRQTWIANVYDRRLCGSLLLIRTEPVPLDFATLQFDPHREAIVASVTCQESGDNQ